MLILSKNRKKWLPVEKPRAFAPRGQSDVAPRGQILLTLPGKIKIFLEARHQDCSHDGLSTTGERRQVYASYYMAVTRFCVSRAPKQEFFWRSGAVLTQSTKFFRIEPIEIVCLHTAEKIDLAIRTFNYCLYLCTNTIYLRKHGLKNHYF